MTYFQICLNFFNSIPVPLGTSFRLLPFKFQNFVFFKYPLQWAEKEQDISTLGAAEHWIRHYLIPEKERDISTLGAAEHWIRHYLTPKKGQDISPLGVAEHWIHHFLTPEPILSIESGRVIHVLWGTTCWPLDVSC